MILNSADRSRKMSLVHGPFHSATWRLLVTLMGSLGSVVGRKLDWHGVMGRQDSEKTNLQKFLL